MSAPPQNPEARPFFGRVESLRGLGALAVATYHFAGCALNGVQLLPAAPWTDAGPTQNVLRWAILALLPAHAAVMAFFVISGFVLRVSLEHGPQQPSAATVRFLISRVFRAYPIIVFAVALTALSEPAGTLTLQQTFANALLFDVAWNRVLWALQVELLMAPAIVALYFLEKWRGPRALILVALVTTALAFKSTWAGWAPISVNFFAFALGMLIPTIGRRFVAKLSRRGAAMWAACAFVAFVLPNPCFGRYSRASTVIEAYAAFVLVGLIAYRQDMLALKCLDAKPLRWLGMSSVSYYVLHTMTAPLALAIAAAIVPAAWSAAAPVGVGVVVIAVWLVAIAPLMVGTYYLIELPGIALGRRVVKLLRIGARPAPVLTPVEVREVAARRAA